MKRRAVEGSCDGCAFFCEIIESCTRWSGRTQELEDQALFLNASLHNYTYLRLESEEGLIYCADDAALDYCVAKGEGTPSLHPVSFTMLVLAGLT